MKFLGNIFLGHQGPTRRDIPDPGPGMSRTRTLCTAAFSVVLDREIPNGRDVPRFGLGCPRIRKTGKSNGGLSKGGLGPKGANWAKKGPFGAISALPPWLWGAEELVPIGPEKAPIGPEKVPICPEKARFRRKDFPPIFSENLGLKPPFVSPPLDFPKKNFVQKNFGLIFHSLNHRPLNGPF